MFEGRRREARRDTEGRVERKKRENKQKIRKKKNYSSISFKVFSISFSASSTGNLTSG